MIFTLKNLLLLFHVELRAKQCFLHVNKTRNDTLRHIDSFNKKREKRLSCSKKYKKPFEAKYFFNRWTKRFPMLLCLFSFYAFKINGIFVIIEQDVVIKFYHISGIFIMQWKCGVFYCFGPNGQTFQRTIWHLV